MLFYHPSDFDQGNEITRAYNPQILIKLIIKIITVIAFKIGTYGINKYFWLCNILIEPKI